MKWHQPLELLLLLHTIFLTNKRGTVLGNDADRNALLELKSLFSDPYQALNSWTSTNASHCSWFGVTCDGASQRVVALNIAGNNPPPCATIFQYPSYDFGSKTPCSGGGGINVKIKGSLSASVAKLAELTVLSLPFNELSGEIPMELWSMEKLEILNLEGNLLYGSLPQQFEGLTNLKTLNLGFNDLNGAIPMSLSKIRGLEVLNLAGNRINGSIPDFTGGFNGLKGLYLSYNLLGGSIPLGIGGDSCKALEHLDLSGNFLNGEIPKSLGNCSALKTLILYSNMLDGGIPGELGGLSQLQVLDVSRNNFGSSIPYQLGNCTKLSVLVLSNLWDPLPLGSNRTVLDEYNFYEGTIPSEILGISSLRMIWAPRTTLQGDFPGSWGSCDNLEVVNLAQNYFFGAVSDGISSCKKLRFLDLSSNGLRGSISDKISVPCMAVFNVSGNHFSGPIPKFSYEQPCRSPMEQPLQPYDPSSVYLSYFRSRAQKEASLPFLEDFDSSSVLHDFSSNNFTGQIQSLPIGFERLGGNRTIYAFLASNNKLTGNFTTLDTCDRANGVMIDVSQNMLSGQVLKEISSACKNLILLDASRNRIDGTIPSEIGEMGSLRFLDLSSNSLQGAIPNSLGEVKDLRYLSFAGNNLNGSIPSILGDMNALRVLDLSSNSLSGEIPTSLSNLKNLTILLLNNNKLSGPVPPSLVDAMSAFSKFNVSSNNLSGSFLPQNNECTSFLENPLIRCSSSTSSSPAQSPPSKSPRKHSSSKIVVIASITSSAAILCLVSFLAFFFYARRLRSRSKVSVTLRKEVFLLQDMGFPMNYDNIVACFKASNCIGSGGFGATYKTEISPGVVIAIKQLNIGHLQQGGAKQFDTEVKTLGRLKHPNLVTLLGYYAGESDMFLIYNYLPGGNLDKFLEERSQLSLDWKILHKIALNVAKALAYLHDQCHPRILHRDVKPSNILLDEDCNAYLSDFGLARIMGNSQTHTTTGPTGTYGYVAPEYAITCKVSEKADVYSYGIVLLEMVSEKKALDPSFSSYGHGFNIVSWAAMMVREGCGERVFHPRLWGVGPREDLVRVLELAVNCTDETLSGRPRMKNVVKRLEEIRPRRLEESFRDSYSYSL